MWYCKTMRVTDFLSQIAAMIVTMISTSGNTWGGIAVYTDSTTYSQGADIISITGTAQ